MGWLIETDEYCTVRIPSTGVACSHRSKLITSLASPAERTRCPGCARSHPQPGVGLQAELGEDGEDAPSTAASTAYAVPLASAGQTCPLKPYQPALNSIRSGLHLQHWLGRSL